MSEQSYAPRYKTFSPDLLTKSGYDAASSAAALTGEPDTPGRFDRFHRVLTWSILSVCLAVWAVVGFVFWVPFLLRSMFRFTFALSGSMLAGEQPVEAGRILRETVSFYRRGFTVAIDAVFGGELSPGTSARQKSRARVSTRYFVFEVLGAFVFWYLVLLFGGVVDASPVDGWIGLVQLDWSVAWAMLLEWSTGLFRS
jgi:hypothetical protein